MTGVFIFDVLLTVVHACVYRNLMGLMYLFSLGLLGIGWLVDLIRLPWLVAEANREEEEAVLQGFCRARQRNHRFYDLRERTLSEAYLMWFPMGLLGTVWILLVCSRRITTHTNINLH